MVYHCFTGVGILARFNIKRNMLNTIRLCKPGCTKSHTSLDNIVSLENRIAYDFGRDHTTAQRVCAVA